MWILRCAIVSYSVAMDIEKSASSRLHISNGYVIFEGSIPGTTDHRHHALEIFIGVEGPVTIISGQQVHCGRILVMNANTLHRVPGSSERRFILMLDNESIMARGLKEKFLPDCSVANLSTGVDADSLIEALSGGGAAGNLSGRSIYSCIIDHLFDSKQSISPPDVRICRAQDYLRGLPAKKVPLSVIAKEVHLSEGRLAHLFKEQVGIPIRRYQLWLRLIDSVQCILEGRSLTEAAHQAEFSDYAHLSRTFTQMFGYSLSSIFKNCTAVEIIPSAE
jgi:AraC-like DNA-binding protein